MRLGSQRTNTLFIMRKIFLLLLVAVFMPRNTFAYDFEVDSIYYEAVSLTDFTCRVVSGDVKYRGNIVIPETVNYGSRTLAVVEIGASAFRSCADLESVTIPNSVTKINSYAFYDCSYLKRVTIGNSVEEIGTSAFENCKELTSITIPNSTIKIADAAFRYCSKLKDVIIGNSVKEIGNYAFYACSELTDITIPNSTTTIYSYAFYGCSKLKSMVMGNSVESIGYGACAGCSSLTSVVIPNSVKTIGYYAFQNCSSLKSVTLGSYVKEIGSQAFDGCNALTTLYSLNTIPPSIYANSFVNNSYMLVNVYVPQERVEEYQNSNIWKNFWNIMEYTGEEPDMKAEKCATPVIQYTNGKLTYSCATKDAVCQTSITDADIKMHTGNELQLGVTYNITVYATKAGCEQSDAATATLCWIDAEPKIEGLGNGVSEVKALPILIQSVSGQISISGLDDGTQVSVYEVSGVQAGSAVSNGGQVSISTNMESGSIAIIKIGDRSIKALMK